MKLLYLIIIASIFQSIAIATKASEASIAQSARSKMIESNSKILRKAEAWALKHGARSKRDKDQRVVSIYSIDPVKAKKSWVTVEVGSNEVPVKVFLYAGETKLEFNSKDLSDFGETISLAFKLAELGYEEAELRKLVMELESKFK
jgi:hypothetical protein